MAKYWDSMWWIKWSIIGFRFMYAILFASVILSVLMVVFGCVNVGIVYGLNNVCKSAVGSVSGKCLELDIFGIEPVDCGADFLEMCSKFARKDLIIAMWGSFITSAGHFYLVSSGGAATADFSQLISFLDLFPRRDEYLKSIGDLSQVINTAELDRFAEKQNEEKESNASMEKSANSTSETDHTMEKSANSTSETDHIGSHQEDAIDARKPNFKKSQFEMMFT